MEVVEVTWCDAQLLTPSDGQFRDPNEFADVKPTPVKVVGWLVEHNKICVVLANEYSPETGEVKLIHVIPKRSVIKITKIKDTGRVAR